ncbi:hypothetical protein BGW41_005164, partial [Actinomortierella wolfii]
MGLMYICVIVSIAGAPGWGVGLFGDALPVFAQKFSSTQLIMLRAMLFIVIVAIAVLLFELLRMLFFLILWLSSIHKHQEIQKTMYRDLHIRNTDKSAAAASSGQESIHSKTSSAVPISWDPAGRNASSTPPPPLPVPQQQQYQQQLQQQQQQANAERAAALSRSRSKLNLPSHVRKKSLGERTRTELQQAAASPSHNLQDLRTQMSDEYDVRSSVALRILDTASATSEYLFTEDLPMVALQQPDHNNNNINNYHRGASSTNVNSTVAAAIASTNNLNNTNHVGSHANHKSGNGNGLGAPSNNNNSNNNSNNNNNNRYLKPVAPAMSEIGSEMQQTESGDERLKSAAAFMAQYMIPDHLMPLFNVNRASQSVMSTTNYPSPAMASSHLNLDLHSNLHPYAPALPERQVPLFNLASQRSHRRSMASTAASTTAAAAAVAAAAAAASSSGNSHAPYRPTTDLASSALTDMSSFIQAYSATEPMPPPPPLPTQSSSAYANAAAAAAAAAASTRNPYAPSSLRPSPVVAVDAAAQPISSRLVSTALTSELVSLIQAYYSASDRGTSPGSTPPNSSGSNGGEKKNNNNNNSSINNQYYHQHTLMGSSGGSGATTTANTTATMVEQTGSNAVQQDSSSSMARPSQLSVFYEDLMQNFQMASGQQSSEVPPVPPKEASTTMMTSSPSTGPQRKMQQQDVGMGAVTGETQAKQEVTSMEAAQQHL